VSRRVISSGVRRAERGIGTVIMEGGEEGVGARGRVEEARDAVSGFVGDGDIVGIFGCEMCGMSGWIYIVGASIMQAFSKI
jgi:hypothetical protein